jgi:hypothetical protein
MALITRLTASFLSVCATIFYTRETALVGQSAPFQIKLSAAPSAQFDALCFDSIELHFSTDRPAVVIDGSDGTLREGTIHLGNIALDDVTTSIHSAPLSFTPGRTMILNGSLSSALPIIGGVGGVFFLSRGEC